MNLDNILNDLDDFIESSSGTIDIETQYPYLIIKKEDLVRAMNLCKPLIVSSSNIPELSSISLVPIIQDKTILLCATNDLSNFRYRAELIGNPDNMISVNISISFFMLQKTVKLMGDKVLFYLKNDNLYIRLLDGDLLLNYTIPRSTILNFPAESTDKIAELSLSLLGDTIDVFSPLINKEIRSDNKKLIYNGNMAFFNSIYFYLQYKIDTPNMVLSQVDLAFIQRLFKYYNNKRLLIFNTDSQITRLFFKLDNIEYLCLNLISDYIVPDFDTNISKDFSIKIPFDKIYRIVELASNISDVININIKDKVYININSNSNFYIDILEGNAKHRDFNINVEVLKRLLNSFNRYDFVYIDTSKNSFCIFNDKSIAFCA